MISSMTLILIDATNEKLNATKQKTHMYMRVTIKMGSKPTTTHNHIAFEADANLSLMPHPCASSTLFQKPNPDINLLY